MRTTLLITAALALAACTELDDTLAGAQDALQGEEQEVEFTIRVACNGAMHIGSDPQSSGTRAKTNFRDCVLKRVEPRKLTSTDNVQHVTNVRLYAFESDIEGGELYRWTHIVNQFGQVKKRYALVPEFAAKQSQWYGTQEVQGVDIDHTWPADGGRTFNVTWAPSSNTTLAAPPYNTYEQGTVTLTPDNYGDDANNKITVKRIEKLSDKSGEWQEVTLKMRTRPDAYYRFLAIGRDDIQEFVLKEGGREPNDDDPTQGGQEGTDFFRETDTWGTNGQPDMRLHTWENGRIEYIERAANTNITRQVEIFDMPESGLVAERVDFNAEGTLLRDIAIYPLEDHDISTPTKKYYKLTTSEVFAGTNPEPVHVTKQSASYKVDVRMDRVVAGILLYVKNVPYMVGYQHNPVYESDHSDTDHIYRTKKDANDNPVLDANGNPVLEECKSGELIQVYAVGIAPHNKYYHAVRLFNGTTAQPGNSRPGTAFVKCYVRYTEDEPGVQHVDKKKNRYVNQIAKSDPDYPVYRDGSDDPDNANTLPLQGVFVIPQPALSNVTSEAGRTPLELVYYNKEGKEICRRTIKLRRETETGTFYNNYRLVADHIYCFGQKGHDGGNRFAEPQDLSTEFNTITEVNTFGNWQGETQIEM